MFTPEWLREREPADAAARSAALAARAAELMPADAVVRVVDLASGTGSNLRYLAERLSGRQSWLLIDQDHDLLAQAPQRIGEWAGTRGYRVHSEPDSMMLRGERLSCRVLVRQLDLSPTVGDLFLDAPDLVTASALLDLVSRDWVERIAARCRRVNSTVLFALTYDGRVRCAPEDSDDRWVIDLVNRHQRTDKGFGVALGPDAVRETERCFRAVGYHVRIDPSDWSLDPSQATLQRALILGWAAAAEEVAPAQAGAIRAWRARRLAHQAAGRSRIQVGHRDLLAWPDTAR